MAATVNIQDQVSGALKALPAELAGQRLNPAIGAAEVLLFQFWFLALPSNQNGWPSTGFWADAARATNYSLLPDGVMVSVNQQGVRQRYQGGEIKPVNASYLTIPARVEAYGHRAGEFDNLRLAFSRSGGRVHPFALVEADATNISYGRKRKDGSRKVTTEEVGGLVMYWLVTSVNQPADENVLPPDNLIVAAAMEVVDDAVYRALQKR